MNLDFSAVFYIAIVIFGLPLLVIRPITLIYLLVTITFFNFIGIFKFSMGPVNIYLSDMLLFLCIVFLSIKVFDNLLRKKSIADLIPPKTNLIILLLFLYLIMHLVFMISAYMHGLSPDSIIRRFLPYSSCFCFFYPMFFVKNEAQVKRLLLFTVILALIFPIWQIYGYCFTSQHFITSSGTVRLTGSSAIHLMGAAIFAILLWKRGVAKYFLAIIPMVALLLIGHRSGIMALVLGLALLFILRKEFVKAAFFSYSALIGVLLFILGLDYFLETSFLSESITRTSDTFNTADENVVGRSHAIINNFKVFLSKPVLGIGYNYEDMAKSFNLLISPNIKNAFYNNIISPHNFIMRLLSHTGLVGTTLIISFIVLIYKKAWTVFKYLPSMKDFGIFAICSITFFLILSLMNTTFFTPGATLFWFLSGLVVTLPKISEGSQNRS